MKKSPLVWPFLAALLLLAGFGSCSRHSATATGNGCISRYLSHTGPLITAGQLDTLDLFFQKNNLPISGLQFQFVYYNNSSSYGTYNGPLYEATTELILNGLRVLPSSMIFTFDSAGALLDSTGGYWGQLPNNDTLSHQSLATLRQLFLNNYKQCVIAGGPVNSTPHQPTAPYQDTCLIAEFVYVDASVQNSSIPSGQQLVKAWLVSSANNPNFPEVTVIDNTGQAIPLKIFLP